VLPGIDGYYNTISYRGTCTASCLKLLAPNIEFSRKDHVDLYCLVFPLHAQQRRSRVYSEANHNCTDPFGSWMLV
jgi:hypothetical protein